MARLHRQNEFTGEILVAEKGHVIYAGAFGPADRSTGQPYTTDTRSCLASLSKPITATAIMMLAEQSRLTYDDALATFLPAFSEAVEVLRRRCEGGSAGIHGNRGDDGRCRVRPATTSAGRWTSARASPTTPGRAKWSGQVCGRGVVEAGIAFEDIGPVKFQAGATQGLRAHLVCPGQDRGAERASVGLPQLDRIAIGVAEACERTVLRRPSQPR